jgi:hypothetical protein
MQPFVFADRSKRVKRGGLPQLEVAQVILQAMALCNVSAASIESLICITRLEEVLLL